VSQNPPPVLGFNNNVRHRGRVFHIQTEDSGVKSPRIVTHLFADGGRIIKTTRTAYADILERSDLTQQVRQMMKDQHKAMFAALRAGDLDELLEVSCGPLPLPASPRAARKAEPAASATASAIIPVVQVAVAASPAPPVAVAVAASPAVTARPSRPLTNPNIFKIPPSVPPPSREAIDLAVGVLEPMANEQASSSATPARVAAEAPKSRKSVPAPRKARTAAAQKAAPARPASSYGSAPTKTSRSIFGDGVISEKSLDEVILSYLAEDLDGSSE
jgi:hypothetical protein